MSKLKTNLKVTKLKLQSKTSRLKKLEVKPLLLPKVLEEDNSTISHVKRIGGQIGTFYSLHTTPRKANNHVDIVYNPPTYNPLEDTITAEELDTPAPIVIIVANEFPDLVLNNPQDEVAPLPTVDTSVPMPTLNQEPTQTLP